VVLRQINGLADHIRDLRHNTVTNSQQIKALTGHLEAKWIELRVLRAPPVREDVFLPEAQRRRLRTRL
jgi:hypothetical protein